MVIKYRSAVTYQPMLIFWNLIPARLPLRSECEGCLNPSWCGREFCDVCCRAAISISTEGTGCLRALLQFRSTVLPTPLKVNRNFQERYIKEYIICSSMSNQFWASTEYCARRNRKERNRHKNICELNSSFLSSNSTIHMLFHLFPTLHKFLVNPNLKRLWADLAWGHGREPHPI